MADPGQGKPSGPPTGPPLVLAEDLPPAQPPTTDERQPRRWLKPAIAGLALLVVSAAAGFGIGHQSRPSDSGPGLTEQEALAEARRQAKAEVVREMARRGRADGKRVGRNHGIIAGGMAAESVVTVLVREQKAAEARSAAAAAQSELAGMTAAPAPPVVPADEGDGD